MRYLLIMGTALAYFGSSVVMANTPTAQPQPQPPTMPTVQASGNLLVQGARDAFARGQRLYDARDYAGALKAWQDSYRLDNRPSILYYIARAYSGLGQYKEAWRVLRSYRDLAASKDERNEAIRELHRVAACTTDVPTAKQVSMHAGSPSLESGEVRHPLEIRNPTADELEVTDIRSPEMEELGIEAQYVGSRVVAPFTTLYGYVLFPAQTTRTLESVTIAAAIENGGGLPFSLQTSVRPMIMLLPDYRVNHVTVSVRGLYGAFFAGTGRNGDTINRITDMRGVAVGVNKGMSEGLAVEGELTYAETGQATFEDMDIDGTTGDLSRKARFARLLGSGVLRTGKENIMSARLSFGLQIASYNSSLSTSTGVMEVPEDGVAFDVLVGGGIGYMRRLGAHWSLGLSGSFSASMTSEAKAIEAGMHLSYGWNP